MQRRSRGRNMRQGGGRKSGPPVKACDLDPSEFLNRDRPPPCLRGREIGMWHRYKSALRKGIDLNDVDNGSGPSQEGAAGSSRSRRGGRRTDNGTKIYTVRVTLPPRKVDAIQQMLQRIRVPRGSFSQEPGSSCPFDKYSNVQESEFKKRFLQTITCSLEEKYSRGALKYSILRHDPSLSEKYKTELIRKKNSPFYCDMLRFRQKLPAFGKQIEIINLLNDNQVILISGETGCGKTTQVAQFILDHEINEGRGSRCKIVCTQPRRISAISVAERVAAERGERLGDSVGFQIRLEHVMPRPTGSILFCTTGVLLQYLQSDPTLRNVSHVILDEVHERDILIDFVITLLKDLLQHCSDLKVVLMSATLNSNKFSEYFNNCPSICIPGFTFPVEEYYLEDVLQLTKYQFRGQKKENVGVKFRVKAQWNDFVREYLGPHVNNLRDRGQYSEQVLSALLDPNSEESVDIDLVFTLIHHICTKEGPGAILVFLPGWNQISSLNRKLTESGFFSSSRYLIIPLHSLLPTVSQRSVFDRPPRGIRKIVLATNIAETSITIDDVVYVIDCGKTKMTNFNATCNISALEEEWISMANVKQRRGRAGRVQEGVCYHLFSKAREMTFPAFQLPEIMRSRLEEVILQIKILQLGLVKPFLSKVMDPPDPRAVEVSVELLIRINALDDEERLTPLGYHLAKLPVHPQAGKMILLGAMFSCLDPITSIASAISFRDPFTIPLGKEDKIDAKKRELSRGCKSDHILLAYVMQEWQAAERLGYGRDFIQDCFLSRNTLELLNDMKKQFTQHLHEMQFIGTSDVRDRSINVNSNNNSLLKAVITGGLYPNVAVLNKKHFKHCGLLKARTESDKKVSIHPKSVNEKERHFESRFLVYHVKQKSSKLYLHDTSVVYPLAILFFSNQLIFEPDKDKVRIKIRGIEFFNFLCFETVADVIKELRDRLEWILEYKVSHPGVVDWGDDSDETMILKAIVELITSEHFQYSNEYEEESDDDYD